jgi:indole-3-glycerol phosphate synthase
VKISESGIHKPEDIIHLRTYGYQGFLMGEHFMKQSRPEKACAEFINKLKSKLQDQPVSGLKV